MNNEDKTICPELFLTSRLMSIDDEILTKLKYSQLCQYLDEYANLKFEKYKPKQDQTDSEICKCNENRMIEYYIGYDYCHSCKKVIRVAPLA